MLPVCFGTRLGVSLQRPKGYQTDGFQNAKFSEFCKIDILVPVCFGTRLGSVAPRERSFCSMHPSHLGWRFVLSSSVQGVGEKGEGD